MDLLGLTQSVTLNRGLVIGVGGFGARTLAHLWARMRFEDDQRQHLSSWLPSLSETIQYALVLPWEGGSILAGSPIHNSIQGWNNDQFLRMVANLTDINWSNPDEDAGKLAQSIRGERIEAKVPLSRSGIFQGCIQQQHRLGARFTQLAELARIDKDAPGGTIQPFRIYIIASLHEELPSAMLWPLVMTLRQALDPVLPISVTGLLGTAGFGEGDERERQNAVIYTALQELDLFSDSGLASDSSRMDVLIRWLPSEAGEWLGKPYFDDCFLLDSEKNNLTRPADEKEIIVSAGNFLETLLISNAADEHESVFGPDNVQYKEKGAFSSIGTSSVCIPIDEWRRLDRDRFLLKVIQEQFLPRSEQIDGEVAQQAQELEPDLLDPAKIITRLIRNCREMRLVTDDRTKFGRGVVSDLLRRANQEERLSPESHAYPLPQVEVDFTQPNTHINYIDPELSGSERRMPYERRLEYLYRRFSLLGMWETWIFPEYDLEGNRQQIRENIEGRQTLLARWLEEIAIATDTSTVPPPDAAQDIPPLSLLIDQAGGILPEMKRLLRKRLTGWLRKDNHGLVVAMGTLQKLQQAVQRMINETIDYRTRLARALTSDVLAENVDDTSAQLLIYNQLLANRPSLPGFLGRGLTMTALLGSFIYLGFPLAFPNLAIPYLLYFSLAAGAVVVSVASLLVWYIHRRRMDRALAHISRNLRWLFNLQINEALARTMIFRAAQTGPEAEGDPQSGSERQGFLIQVLDTINDFMEKVNHSYDGLSEHARMLQTEITRPLTVQAEFIRQPLPGLDELHQKLMDEARENKGEPEISDKIIAIDPSNTSEHLEELIARETEDDGETIEPQSGPVPGNQSPASALLYQGESFKYDSLEDMLINVLERYAQTNACQIDPPEHLKIEQVIKDLLNKQSLARGSSAGELRNPVQPSLRSFLLDLLGRSQVLLYWDEEELDKKFPVELELLALEEPAYSTDLALLAEQSMLRCIATQDPFSLTILRLVKGVRIKSVPHYRAYTKDFQQSGASERVKLSITGTGTPIDEEGNYLQDSQIFKTFSSQPLSVSAGESDGFDESQNEPFEDETNDTTPD